MTRATLCVGLCLVSLGLTHAQSYRLGKWRVPKAHYSGIAALGGDRYAVVSDKDRGAGFHLLTIKVDSLSGKLREVSYEGFRGTAWAVARDAEGIAYCPQRESVFISGEADQRVLEHRLDGTPTGTELHVPEAMSVACIQPNRGFEALGYDAERQLFWTVTESALKGDDVGHLRLLCFDASLHVAREYAYRLAREQAKDHGRDHYHGVVAVTPLPDGSLLTLEREARIAPRYVGSRCWCRLFRFWPATGEKQPIAQWATRMTVTATRFANYEGMCLGPRLKDGRQTLLLVADAQGGAGKAFWHLKDRLRVVIL